ncbi:hypothetical protein KC19_10G017500, partial [Ceratodon purpureus]
ATTPGHGETASLPKPSPAPSAAALTSATRTRLPTSTPTHPGAALTLTPHTADANRELVDFVTTTPLSLPTPHFTFCTDVASALEFIFTSNTHTLQSSPTPHPPTPTSPVLHPLEYHSSESRSQTAHRTASRCLDQSHYTMQLIRESRHKATHRDDLSERL